MSEGGRRVAIVRLVITLVIVTFAIVAAASIIIGQTATGPAQPIPFSHRVHAGTKNISCFFCHPSATKSSNAGIPPLEKCLLCHNVIAAKFRPIAKIHTYADRKEPIPWVRVYRLPDFVHFSHQAHLTNATTWGIRFDCGKCHGNVKQMDRVYDTYNVNQMRFCVNCHQKNGFSTKCFTCHW